MDWLQQLSGWHWIALSLLLLIGELVGAGGYLLWTGISGMAVGALLWIFPGMAWQLQFLLFAVGSVVSAGLWHVYLLHRPIISDQPTLNKRGATYVGKTFVLTQAVQNGRGKIRIDDCNWELNGEDCAVGESIIVTGTDGMILFFEKA
jgi:membrane protein implicated in regulation of membrane protease activity